MEKNEQYFYTATIKNWYPILLEYHLEPIIVDSLQFLSDRKCINVFGFVIMPNHIHLIWEMLKDNGNESPVASFMKFTAHEFKKKLKAKSLSELDRFYVTDSNRNYNFWMERSDQFMLLREDTISQKLDYIHFNPTQEKWGLVKDPEDYYYSSAKFYYTGIKNFDFLSDYRDWEEIIRV